MYEMVSGSLAFKINGGSKDFAPSSKDARYSGLSHTGGESFASVRVIRNDITDDWPLPLSSVAYCCYIREKYYSVNLKAISKPSANKYCNLQYNLPYKIENKLIVPRSPNKVNVQVQLSRILLFL